MTTRQIQCLLLYLGYPVEPDGIQGPKTRGAADAFWSEYAASESLEQALLSAVSQGWKRPLGSMWDEIRYFRREEPFIGCSCGKCGGFPREPEKKLMLLADKVREHFGAPMIPTSTLRCKAHNAAVGGVANSRHLLGKAMDFKIPGKKASEILAYVKTCPEVRYAYEVNSRVVHMDIH